MFDVQIRGIYEGLSEIGHAELKERSQSSKIKEDLSYNNQVEGQTIARESGFTEKR